MRTVIVYLFIWRFVCIHEEKHTNTQRLLKHLHDTKLKKKKKKTAKPISDEAIYKNLQKGFYIKNIQQANRFKWAESRSKQSSQKAQQSDIKSHREQMSKSCWWS